MTIDRNALADYLIARGLLETRAIVDIEPEEGRSNLVYRVHRHDGGRGLFVKIAPSAEPRWTVPLAREAEVCRLFESSDLPAKLCDVLPRRLFYDSDRNVLVFELIPQGRNLTEYHYQEGVFPSDVGRVLGRHLAEVHACFGKQEWSTLVGNIVRRELPWGLRLHRGELERHHEWREAEKTFIAAIRRDSRLSANLDALAADWRPETLIHGDLKWDNCLLTGDDGAGGHGLRFVDWECADIGDPVWDVAAVLQGYLAFWILSLQSNARRPGPAERTPWERLRAMHASIREFVRSYAAVRSVPENERTDFVRRCVRFAGARLLSAVLEYPQLTPAGVHNVQQVSRDLLLNPDQAATELLGIGIG